MMRCELVAGARLAAVLLAMAALAACGGDDKKDKKYSIGGTVAGLGGTVVLQNNGGDNLSVAANGSFTFAAKVKKNDAYAVTVATQPVGQTCTVANGSGAASADVTNVTVACTNKPSHTVGGTVTGLSGTVVLRNGTGDLSVDSNGAFTFVNGVREDLSYAVTVAIQPTGQTCTVANGAGTMSTANVTNVTVTCAANLPPAGGDSIGGTVSGLEAGKILQLRLSYFGTPFRLTKDIASNGTFSFDGPRVPAGMDWTVTVFTQPAGQTCSVANGSGFSGMDVTNVEVTCVAATTDYSVGGTISGLTGAGLKIEDGSANSVTPAAGAATFTLPTRVANNFEYDVGISAQPTGQTCVLIKSHGAVTNADVTNVDVRCVANVTDPIVGTYTVPALSASNTSYVYITLFADGVYIYASVENNGQNCGASTSAEGNGVEYGVYNYNATTHAFAIKSAVVDTNGGCGVWNNASNSARFNGTLTVSGTGQGKTMTLTVPGAPQPFDLVPVGSTAGQIVGSWSGRYQKNFATFISAGGNNLYYMITETQEDNAPTSMGQVAGFEYACASTTALTGGTLTADLGATCQAPAPTSNGPVDTNGTSGLSNSGGTLQFTVSGDTLTPTGGSAASRINPN